MDITQNNGLVVGIQLTVLEANLVKDCLQELLGGLLALSDNYWEIQIGWPRERAEALQGKVRALLGSLEISNVTLTPVHSTSQEAA